MVYRYCDPRLLVSSSGLFPPLSASHGDITLDDISPGLCHRLDRIEFGTDWFYDKLLRIGSRSLRRGLGETSGVDCDYVSHCFFMSAAYTEGLYMFLSTTVFWLAYRKKFWAAGIFGMLAALTRNEGAFTVIPILWSYYQSYGWTIKKSLWSVLLVPAGIVAFMIYQWRDFGSPLAFIAAQSYWGRQITWPWVGIFLAIKTIWHGSPLQPSTILSMIDLCAALIFMILWIFAWRRKFPVDWLAYWGILLLIDISAPDIHGRSPLLSMSRLVLILFPGFVMLGILAKHESWNRFFQWLLPMLQVTFFLIFATWHWIA